MAQAREAAGLGWLAFEDEGMSVQEVKLRLAAIYEVHNPDKLLTLDKELEKHAGAEEKLLRRVLAKYEPDEYERDSKERHALRIRKQLFNVIEEHNKNVLNQKQIVSVVEALIATHKVPCKEDGGGELTEEERVLNAVLSSYSIVDQKLNTRGGEVGPRDATFSDPGSPKGKSGKATSSAPQGGDDSDDDTTRGPFSKWVFRKPFTGDRNLHHKSYADGIESAMPKKNITARRAVAKDPNMCAPFGAAAMAACAPLADQSLNVLSVKELLYTMMQKYNSIKVPKLQHYLKVHQRSEEEMLDMLRSKYEPGPWAARQAQEEHQHMNENATTMRLLHSKMKDTKRDDERRVKELKKENGEAAKDTILTKFGPVPQKHGRFGQCDDVRAEVYFILAKHDPSRLGQLDRLMTEYKYKEETLIRELKEEYLPKEFVVSEIKRYLRTYLPEKVGTEDEALLEEHRGQEHQLLASLKRDFHGVPIPCSANLQEKKDEVEERHCAVSGCVREVLPGKEYCEEHICTTCFENRKNPSLGMCMNCDLRRQGIKLDGPSHPTDSGGIGEKVSSGPQAGLGKDPRFAQVLGMQRRTKQFLKAANRTFRFIGVRVDWDLRRRYFKKLRKYAEKCIKRQHEQFYHNLLFNPDVDLRKREHRIRHRKGQCTHHGSDCDEESISDHLDPSPGTSHRAQETNTSRTHRMESLEAIIENDEVDEETFYSKYLSLQLQEEALGDGDDDAESVVVASMQTHHDKKRAYPTSYPAPPTPVRSILKTKSKLSADTATAGELLLQGRDLKTVMKTRGQAVKKANRIVLYCGAKLEAVEDDAGEESPSGSPSPSQASHTLYYCPPPDPIDNALRALGEQGQDKQPDLPSAPPRLPVLHLMYCTLSRALYVRCEKDGDVASEKIPIQFDRKELEKFQHLADKCHVPHDLEGDGDRTDRYAALLLRSADRQSRHRPWSASSGSPASMPWNKPRAKPRSAFSAKSRDVPLRV
eukprot:TRINITY_DN20966_c0_g1_i1.p1 TRINITY_DN20966_c0_g1~~TRINITY_DN20966_c0_g1_i1.p1  ORF type:complete len:985 (+),score=370.41 TRINITY_DN20966_c0_g1_i1:103-3057(+)